MKSEFLKLTNAVYKVLEFFPESDPLKNRAKDRALAIMEHLILLDETSGWLSFQKEKVKVQILEDIDILLGYLWIGKSQGWLNSVNCLIIASEYEKVKKEIEPVMELTQKLPGIDNSKTLASEESEKSTPSLVLESVATVEPSVVSSFAKAMEDKKDLEGREETPILANENEETENILDSTEPVIVDDKVRNSERQNPPSFETTARQGKILDFLTKNEKAQVMDLQTVLPDVTKRTIRRDLDELLEVGQIVRRGDFNQVFYQIAQVDAGGLGGGQHLVS